MINHLKDTTNELALPQFCISKEGFEFYPNDNIWVIVDQVKETHFRFEELSEYYDDTLILSFKFTLIFYIENYALSHPYNMYNLFLNFTRTLPSEANLISCISSTHIINYKAKLGKDVWYLGSLKGFFKKWHRLRHPGIDDEVIRLLNSMRIKGNPKGNAVRTMDPEKGPFTENELMSIHEELCLKYASGVVSNRGFALAWLSMAIGQRPVQFSMAKVKDFEVIPAGDGSIRYMINLPRAKQRGVEARELFSRQPICQEAGTALAVWIEQLRSADTGGIAFKELPIFPRWGHVSPIGLHHMTSQMLGVELTDTINSLEVVSERTGAVIKFQSKRFKYTVGTRAAEEGHGEMVIARLLDHTDTQNVRVYVESTSKVAGIIDKAMGPFMAPIAQAFKGMIILSDNDCPNGIRIYSGNALKGDVGKCGHHGFCGAAAPHVCYVCVNFHPWLDGPHEDILKELSDERIRLLAITSDKRISGAKDRLIMAVTQVVNKCNEMRKLEVVNG